MKRPTQAQPFIVALAAIGFAAGFAAHYIYLNVAFIERLAAETDGFPLWSVWQIPFALPGGVLGAIVGAGIGAVTKSLAAARPRNS